MDYGDRVTDAENNPKVVLVSPPWRIPDEGCLSLATLSPILKKAGIPCDELHGTQLYPYTPTDLLFLSNYAAHFFVPQLYDNVGHEQVIAAVIARFIEDLNLQGLVLQGDPTLAELGRDEQALRESLHGEIVRAEKCVSRCVAEICHRKYDIVGFSVTFETQLIAALAIARRVKALNPAVKVAFGGAACFQELGTAVARSFPEVDVVCHCEGERVVVPLMKALRDGAPLTNVPGIVWRQTDGRLRRNPCPPPIKDLDQLPVPDYDKFVTALDDSEWRGFQAKLFFETSRGCWWGQRKHCSFCGLNPEGLPFRHKSPPRAFDDIRALYELYPTARRLQATDNILDMSYFEPVLTNLAAMERERNRPLRIFLEVKPNLKKEKLRAIAKAGVDLIQPGVESFSDDVLRLLNKGCTVLGNVQFIKWATEVGILLTYNLIVRSPGEEAQWYSEMTELVAAIEHLPPPTNTTPVWLERFSPFHTTPERFGITGIRSKPHYRALFRDLPVDIDELAYVFDYDHECHHDAELYEALRRFVFRVGQWQQSWSPNQAYYLDDGETVQIVDRRDTDETTAIFHGWERDLFLFLDRARTAEAISRHYPDVPAAQFLSDLLQRLWVIRDKRGRFLAVLPQRESRGSRSLDRRPIP